MSYVRTKPFSTFCREIGLVVHMPVEGGGQGVRISRLGNSGLVRLSPTFILQAVQWASYRCGQKVEWDLGSSSLYDYSTYCHYWSLMSGKPTECFLDPGTAYTLNQGVLNFSNDLESRPILPRKGLDGSYAYRIEKSGLKRPQEWASAAIAGGFSVRETFDGLSYYGSRFAGGDQNFSPPLAFITWLARPGYVPRQALVKNRFLGGGTFSKKTVASIPNYASCQELKNALVSGNCEEVQAVLKRPPPVLKQFAYLEFQKVEVQQKWPIMDVMCSLVRGRVNSGKKVDFKNFLALLRNEASNEQEYCSVVEAFDRVWEVDWSSSAQVTPRDKVGPLG